MARRPRKLAAIVAADIIGYTALTERDQDRAAEAVVLLRERADAICQENGGRIFSTAGDGIMLEFPAASAALTAAISLGETLRDPPLRFGVHLGEVTIASNGDLLGHGVNVAARLQAAALNGGIMVSEIVRDSVNGALAERLASRGRIRLEKMRETLNVYFIDIESGFVANAAPDPVLAVLAFENQSRDRETGFFSDGVSEEILYAVSHIRGLKVIGSTSSFAFRGRDKSKASKALGATHILDGSVRRTGDRVRITAQLSEGATGFILWNERYDRDLGEAEALQEEIAAEVANALTLTFSEARRASASKLTAAVVDTYLRARERLKSGIPARVQMAAEAFEEIVREAPQFARAWAGLATARLEILRLVRENRGQIVEDAREAAQRALGIDPNIGEAYAVLATLESDFGRWRARERLIQRALEVEPNNPFLLFRHGQFLVSTGRVAQGYAQQGRAYALDPLDPMFAAFHAYNIWSTQSRPEGRRILEEAALRAPDNVFVWYMRYNLAALDGDLEDARALRSRGIELLPELAESAVFKASEMMHDVLANPSQEAFIKLGEDFATMAAKEPSSALDIAVVLSWLGFARPALECFEEALDNVDAWRQGALQAARPHIGYETALLFIDATRKLRMERDFVRLCARLGLVRYWTHSGNWPDCVDEVASSYDFKAACAEFA